MKSIFVVFFALFCFVNAQNFIFGNGYYLLNQFRQSGFNGDGLSGPATATNFILGFDKHPNGDIYFSDYFNCRVRKLSAATNKVSTIIGNGVCQTSGNGGLGTAASTSGPVDVAVDPLDSNILFIVELNSNAIRKYNIQTGIVTHFAGRSACSSDPVALGDGGSATNGAFCNPVTIGFDGNNNILIVDFFNKRVRKIDRNANIITTILGTGFSPANGAGPAISRNLNLPTGIALNPITNEIFASGFDQLIRKIDASGFASNFAGTLNAAAFSGENIPISGSTLANPGRMDFDAQGNLFFWEAASNGGGRLRKADVATSTINTIAGGGNTVSVNNISALQFQFEYDPIVSDVSSESDGNIIINDLFSMVRVIGVAAPENECGNGIVESGEECDSANPCCDTNCKFQPSSQVCRAAAGPCDISEFCSGNSELCPSDVLAPTSTLCGQSFGVCEVGIPTSCTGTSAACPTVPSILQLPAVGNTSAVNMQWSSFSVVSFANINGNTGRLQGRIAAKTDISFGNGFSVADSLIGVVDGGEPYSLVSGRNLNFLSGALFPNPIPSPLPFSGNAQENGFAGEVENVATFLEDQILSQGCGANLGCLNGDFDSYQTYLANTVQPYLASLSQNVNAFVQFSGLMIECSDNSSPLYVLNTDAATIAGVTWYSIRGCNGLASWVINIKDEPSSVTFAGDNLPTISERTVFNILGSGRTINVQTLVNGNILSPKNTLSQTGGTINGRVYVANVVSVLDVALVRCTVFKTVIIVDFLAIQANVGSTTITVVSGGNIFVGDLVTIGTQTLTVVSKTNNADGSATLTLSGAVAATASALSSVKFEFTPAVTGSRFDASKSLLVVADSALSVFASFVLIGSIVVALVV